MCWIIRAFSIGIVLALASAHAAYAQNSKPAEVIILSTLHQMHDQTAGYSFDDLTEIIEELRPDLLAVELTASDLESRRDQSTKQEYQRSVFPLLDKHQYEVIPLEPSEPLFSELVGLLRASSEQLQEQSPAVADTFKVYTESLYSLLSERWVTAAAVNSPDTDILFESKHRFQSAIFGHAEARVWDEWNQHFLQKILAAATTNPGKRILVLVGAEHAYWLRAHLKSSDVSLLDTSALLDEFSNATTSNENRR